MFQFNFLRYNDFDSIIDIIKKYDVVSFDIFDTLLKRDASSPAEVFKFIEQEVGNNFADCRIQAEKRARKTLHKEEITLDDIYSFLPSEFLYVKEFEKQYEEELLTKNTAIIPIYEYCRKSNKKIVITSDMYLPQSLLERVLHDNEILYDMLYLSSSIGKQKVTGNLFRYLLKDLAINSTQIVHIGDSVRGDFLGARRAGIKGILIPKRINNTVLFDLNNKSQNHFLNCFINNHIDWEKDNYYKVGFSCFGPVLYGFVKWLNSQAGDKKFFFFSRDGFIIKQVYDLLYKKKSAYIYVSRRSLSVPLLWKHSEWNEIFDYITMTRYFTLHTFLERLGLIPNKYNKILIKYGLSFEDVYHQNTVKSNEKLRMLYECLKKDVVTNSKIEYEALCSYLKANHFTGNVAVVDIGWNGSMQKCLVEVLKLAHIDATVQGFYFGIRKQIPGITVFGYFYDKAHWEYEPKLSFMQGLFESFFLSHEGSTKNYEFDNKGYAKPVLYEPEYKERDKEFVAFKMIQTAAIDFCIQFSESSLAKQPVTKDTLVDNLLRFGIEPSLAESEWFGDFKFYDTNIVYIAKPNSLFKYLQAPPCLLRDFSYAVWKAAFVKRLLRINLPYYKIYSTLKLIKR